MKTCSKCLEDKEDENFRWRNKSKGWRSPWCKVCFSEYEKEKWKTSENRRECNKEKREERSVRNCQFIWNYLKNNGCVDCGNNNPIVLDFDHRDPSEKSRNVSDMRRTSYSLIKIEEEIKKCDILCANCHRIKTSKQFNYYKNINNE